MIHFIRQFYKALMKGQQLDVRTLDPDKIVEQMRLDPNTHIMTCIKQGPGYMIHCATSTYQRLRGVYFTLHIHRGVLDLQIGYPQKMVFTIAPLISCLAIAAMLVIAIFKDPLAFAFLIPFLILGLGTLFNMKITYQRYEHMSATLQTLLKNTT